MELVLSLGEVRAHPQCEEVDLRGAAKHDDMPEVVRAHFVDEETL